MHVMETKKNLLGHGRLHWLRRFLHLLGGVHQTAVPVFQEGHDTVEPTGRDFLVRDRPRNCHLPLRGSGTHASLSTR